KNLLHDQRRKSHGRLVQKEQFRLCHEIPANGEHLLLTAGECPCHLLAPFFEPGKKFVDMPGVPADRFLALSCAETKVGPEFKIVSYGEPLEYLPSLGHLRYPDLHDPVG